MARRCWTAGEHPDGSTRLWAERAAGSSDPQLRLIQVEGSLSRTAARAWQWIPVRAGSESALAAGLARVLIEERLVAARGPMPSLSVDEAADQTGLTSEAIRELARTIVARTPAVAIASDDNPAIAALNVVLGAVGTRGGIVRRSKQAQVACGGRRGHLVRARGAARFERALGFCSANRCGGFSFRGVGWTAIGAQEPIGCFLRRAFWRS